ncbi:MAG: DNA cytosine methyltransferase [Thermoguttaceae bacterium]|nr:DNA cytosine methyltransferase [Thermoguttaceae bacterium]
MAFYSFHLFAGIGGGILADVALGFRPVGAVKNDSFCQKVLLSRQAARCLPWFPIWDDVRTFSASNPKTSDFVERLRSVRNSLVICGGFPCQDVSIAGKGVGLCGEKSGLWKDFSRVVREIRPGFVFLENSPELVRRGLSDILTDFAALGYAFTWGVVSAAAVGAPHLRRRFWGLAVSDSNLQYCQKLYQFIATKTPFPGFKEFCCSLSNPRYKWSSGVFGSEETYCTAGTFDGTRKKVNVCGQWRDSEPVLGRVADGFSHWLDRFGQFDESELSIPRIVLNCKNRANKLRALGNAQVPICAAVAFVVLLSRFLQV